MTYRIAYLGPTYPWLHEVLRSELPSGLVLDPMQRGDHAEAEEKVAGADFVVALKVDAALVSHMHRVRLIQYHGVGYHKSIDIDACRAARIPVAFTPDGNTVEVAEHVIMSILALYRQLMPLHNALVSGRWLMWEMRPTMYNLAGKTVGIVGFGRIGQELARKLLAFDVTVLYNDVRPPGEGVETGLAAYGVPLVELVARSDAVVLCVPGTASTRHLINASLLSVMKPAAVLVNVARGDVVDETALVAALQSGRLGGAALDVFTQEPPPPGSPILQLNNVLLTPHVGSGTVDSLRAKARAWYDNFQRVARGDAPLNVVPESVRQPVEHAGVQP
jgi:phosphoglycerate dehydrogenase-like enzyme